VAPGENEELTPDELRKVVGDDTSANRAGVSEDEAATGLAALLPRIVDRVTPNSSIPQSAEIDRAANELERLGR